jgi:hypothetical protein
MKQLSATLIVGALIAASTPASAAGCLKDAVVGGAMPGCTVGHHMAAKAKREKLRQDEQQSQTHGG